MKLEERLCPECGNFRLHFAWIGRLTLLLAALWLLWLLFS